MERGILLKELVECSETSYIIDQLEVCKKQRDLCMSGKKEKSTKTDIRKRLVARGNRWRKREIK